VSAPEAAASSPPSRRRRQGWLLALGLALLVAIIVANDARAVASALLRVRFAATGVVAAHLLVTAAAAMGWWALLARAQRPGLLETFRLRLVKEAVNALLPVAQVGGDVVRARLATSPRLPLRTAAASCIIDVFVGLGCLALFVLLGLFAASVVVTDRRVDRLALQLAVAGALVTVGLVAAERLGLLRLLDAAIASAGGALGQLSGLGAEVARLGAKRWRLLHSAGWHLLSWSLGVAETWTSLWAVGIHPDWRQAFVLESMAQGARALGFAIPGALGVQEGGYVLVCSALGIAPRDALALSLLRRLRELVLGGAGLALWRFWPERAEA
jgi:putative membrane protein